VGDGAGVVEAVVDWLGDGVTTGSESPANSTMAKITPMTTTRTPTMITGMTQPFFFLGGVGAVPHA
jgi:hypothetical protein